VESLQKAYRLLVKSKLNTSQALERIAEELQGQPDVDELVQFIRSSERGFIK
jgi:UDP-N-acetylglucosamine acyltransferase